jgi:hypothetical protein
MSGPAAFTVGLVGWAAAAYGFVLLASAWYGVMRLAPTGQRLAAMLELGRGDFPAVRQRLGPAAEPLATRFRRGVIIFLCGFVPFFAALLITIASGNAA